MTGDLQGRERFLAWPGLSGLRLTLPLSYLFFKIFYSVYGGASLLAKLRRPHVDFYFPWEMRLPFLPAWTLVYLTVPLLLLLTPFVLRTWRSFMPFFLTLTAETLVAGVFFLAVPLAQAYPPRVASGFLGGVFHMADRLNLDYNKLPSLHLAFAVTAAIVFGRRCGWLGRTLLSLWVVAVSASALLIHEHQVLDLAAGLALGLAGVATVQRRTSDDRLLDTLRIDGLCLQELSSFARWRPRRLRPFFTLTRVSLFRWRQTRTLRAAYCLALHVDDVLNGGRRVKGDPEEDVRSVLRVLAGGAPAAGAVAEQLAAFLAAVLDEERKRELGAQLETMVSRSGAPEGRKEIMPAIREIFLPPSPASSAGTAPAPPRSAASQ
ncbi:MAG: hypothetical protein ACJ76Y_11520 [Thermoanaerobaculia bacterium]